ncbi:Protein of unknown function [Desulfocicer vacuolatum DSM 3385]|uniref:DUF1156 domain-containing protein n=1 Tax=Desulfocicer vacuolatum DSM 3385 TaxID=1121400 RepID=A0A1W2A4C1_9BACT|nr:DUF1156 domain-containing protein [Desulfocicer vacuolatum]SMC55261.1 Protein of unknown function [Desulfocicer vacuolatum DSM 3385]
MAKAQPWKDKGMKKADWLAEEVAKAVGAGKPWECETVDFSDPHRPLTCIEVDFPIIPINQIAAIEGNAGKPIYQMSKWWARRRSSVFRAMLLASAIKAPDDPSEAARLVWNAYYGNHQQKGAFKDLKVADIFMGGGTTIVEGSRLGMQMYGNDLNPVAWFIVKNEMAKVDKEEVESLLAEIEAEVKPQIMPFYTCDCPRGHKGQWTQVSTGEIMGEDFDPFALSAEQRKGYTYQGPEIIYVFWAKHGPCQVTGCGHRTPIMSTPVMAVKTLSVKHWKRRCKHCKGEYDLEARDARMAPGVPLVVADTEYPFVVASLDELTQKPQSAVCPLCGEKETFGRFPNGTNKKVSLSLLVHPDWLKGEAGTDPDGRPYGGSADDPVEETIPWNQARAESCKLIEVRGKLPEEIVCPETGVVIHTGKEGGTVPKRSNFSCGGCGTVQDVLKSVKASGKTGPVSMYAIQGYCPCCHEEGQPYGGRFFVPVDDSRTLDASLKEWGTRKNSDLDGYYPKESLFKYEHGNDSKLYIQPDHGFTHWWKMFNPRQMIVHTSLLKALKETKKDYNHDVKMFVIGGIQQYLRNQNIYCFWDISRDCMAPHMSNNNYHPKNNFVENCVFPNLGRGNFQSCIKNLLVSLSWSKNPWEIIRNDIITQIKQELSGHLTGKSEKVFPGDQLFNHPILECGSATELKVQKNSFYDFVVTDPPFGSLIHYSDLSDFFYPWLRIALKDQHRDYFSHHYTPKILESIANRGRNPGKDHLTGKDNADIFYQRLLTSSWKEAHRILKPGGMLAFTFHHSEDAPWVSVLESLFNAGFYLQATYPIRSDETKGSGEFGSRKIEYDIIHVCRKRNEDSKPISWAKLRRQILRDVRDLQELLEHHQEAGLMEADLQVIRRGKALEYFSRHYGKVYKDQDTPISVLEALVGINQLLDEEAEDIKEPPPYNAEPFTRMLLRLFHGVNELPRDQIHKFLRGTGSAPSDYVERGWVYVDKKIFHLTPPLDMAKSWVGKQKKNMNSDYDQAMFFTGACFEGSGINAADTLNNPKFTAHPALGEILKWLGNHGGTPQIRNAAITASRLYEQISAKKQPLKQLDIFGNPDDGE